MEIETKIMEGEKEIGETSTPDTQQNLEVETTQTEQTESPVVSLSNPITPTQEEKEDAGLIPDTPETTQPPVLGDTVVEEQSLTPETPDTKSASESGLEENPFSLDGVATKMFTQSQVDEIAGKTRVDTREKTFRYIYGRYGVDSEEQLDELVGRAQKFDLLQEDFDTQKKSWEEHNTQRDRELVEIKEQVALMQSGIDSNRYEDAKLILKGKGLEVNLENIERELATHPEWKKVSPATNEEEKNFVKVDETKTITPAQVSKVSVLGNEASGYDGESEEDYALNKIFKV